MMLKKKSFFENGKRLMSRRQPLPFFSDQLPRLRSPVLMCEKIIVLDGSSFVFFSATGGLRTHKAIA